jgi:hypothetical protein
MAEERERKPRFPSAGKKRRMPTISTLSAPFFCRNGLLISPGT